MASINSSSSFLLYLPDYIFSFSQRVLLHPVHLKFIYSRILSSAKSSQSAYFSYVNSFQTDRFPFHCSSSGHVTSPLDLCSSHPAFNHRPSKPPSTWLQRHQFKAVIPKRFWASDSLEGLIQTKIARLHSQSFNLVNPLWVVRISVCRWCWCPCSWLHIKKHWF